MKWYADNSELMGIKDAALPDILMFGGIALDLKAEIDLRTSIEKIKETYGDSRAPIKWNMRDLEGLYKKHENLDQYQRLIKSSAEWRAKIFECIAANDVALIVACIEGYSTSKDMQMKTREGLVRFAFNNGLMRFGLHVRDKKALGATVVMDWPDGNDPNPFNEEYAFAYGRGVTPDKIEYHCGRLRDLGFTDSTTYTNTRHSTLLQAADLVVGATRELVECCLEKRRPGQGVECLKIAKGKFRGAPNDILGRGLSVSSGNAGLAEKLKAGLAKFL